MTQQAESVVPGAVISLSARLGSPGPKKPQQHIAIETPQEFVDAERTYARQLRRTTSYIAAAAQPTYGFMAFEPVQNGRIQEVLFISIFGNDPYGVPDSDQSFGGGAANAAATATIPAVAGSTNFVTGVLITGLGATAATTVNATISGLLGGVLNVPVAIPAGVTTPITPVQLEFTRPLPASAVNTAITAQLPAFGAGNTQANIYLQGFTRSQGLVGQAAGFISTFVPQDSNVEPPFPNLVLGASNLPIINAPSRRQVLIWPTERFVIALKGLANNAQVQCNIQVVEYELSTFLKGLAP